MKELGAASIKEKRGEGMQVEHNKRVVGKVAQFRVGDTVFHRRYGKGIVLRLKGESAEVEFVRSDSKKEIMIDSLAPVTD